MLLIDRRIIKRSKMHPKKPFTLYMYLLIVGIIFTISGIILFCISSIIYEAILKDNMTLAPGTTAYEMWLKNPIPLDMKLYLFNWTNPEKIHEFPEVKPRFELLGPYCYSETKEKADIIWNDNDTVTYKHKKQWYYEPWRSNGSLSDLVTNVNPIALSAAYLTREFSYPMKMGLSLTFDTTQVRLTSTHTVSEILFEGYEEGLLKMASVMTNLFKANNAPKMDKFGWFYGRNGSTDFEGVFNANTGVSNQIGQLTQWKYSDRTPYYPGDCGRFDNSSAGDFFPNKLTKDSIVKMFSPDLCRYVELEFEKEVVVQGIVGYKFAAFDRFLDNGTKIPENKCFCSGNCMPSGALNVSTCRHGSPAFVSLPHFFKADPYYLDAVDGLAPSKDKHDFYMIFEPKTALPLQVSARLQINLQLQRIRGIRLYADVPEIYIPVVYFDQSITIPSGIAFLLKLMVNFDVICAAIASILMCFGIFTSLFMCYKLCTANIFDNDRKQDVKIPEEVPLNK